MSTILGKRPPLVSVIVPTHAERALRLQSALASIWAQDGLGEQFDVEPIVVDDVSTGPTEEVVRRFPGTRYVRLATNRGLPAARNAGLREATGEYVAFLDDDDLWLPHRLSRQVVVLEQAQGVEVAYSQRARYMRDGALNVFPGPEAPSGWVFETALKELAICNVETILVPRAALDKVGGFDESLSARGDPDFLARLAFFFPFRYIPGVVSIYLPSMTGRSPQQSRRAVLTKRDNILALIEGEPNEAELRKLVLGTTSWHVTHFSYRAGAFEEARREFLQWLAEFPPDEGDTWARSRMKEMILLLAFASDSPTDEAKSLCAEVRRTGGQRGSRQRLQMRAFLADVWTAVALRLASGRQRNSRVAGSAAARAIFQNPLKPLSRPGLLRLVARAMAPF